MGLHERRMRETGVLDPPQMRHRFEIEGELARIVELRDQDRLEQPRRAEQVIAGIELGEPALHGGQRLAQPVAIPGIDRSLVLPQFALEVAQDRQVERGVQFRRDRAAQFTRDEEGGYRTRPLVITNIFIDQIGRIIFSLFSYN